MVFGWAIRVAKCLRVPVGYAILVRLYSGSVQANTDYILISTHLKFLVIIGFCFGLK